MHVYIYIYIYDVCDAFNTTVSLFSLSKLDLFYVYAVNDALKTIVVFKVFEASHTT